MEDRMTLAERAVEWWSGLPVELQVTFVEQLGCMADPSPSQVLELRIQVQPHEVDRLDAEDAAAVREALQRLESLGTHREWFEAEHGPTTGQLAAFLDGVEGWQGRRIAGLAYIGDSWMCDFTGAFTDGYDDVRHRDADDQGGRTYAPLCCLYKEPGSEPLYCTLTVALPDGEAPVWLVEPSGGPEEVAPDLDTFLGRLAQ